MNKNSHQKYGKDAGIESRDLFEDKAIIPISQKLQITPRRKNYPIR